MSVRVDFHQPWPFMWHNGVITTQPLTMIEAARLWWLPKKFTGTMTITCPYTTVPFDPYVFDFTTLTTSLERVTAGVYAEIEEERNLCFPGLYAGSNIYASSAPFTGEIPDTGGIFATLTHTLFQPVSGSASGLLTDGADWKAFTRITGNGAFPDTTFQLLTEAEADDLGTVAVDYKAISPVITYKPESPTASYDLGTSDTLYLYVSTGDIGDWECDIAIEEAEWYAHGGIWSTTPGTARLIDPG